MAKNKLILFVLLTLVVFSLSVISASSISERTLGKESAPVTVEMFADFECPYCAMWHTQTFPLIKENYINEGKVKLIIRHLPLESIHFNAKNYAIASQCAADQGKFFEYIDLLYSDDSSNKDILSYAKDLGLDLEEFEYCINDPATLEVINKDMQRAAKKGIENGTPSFLINGKKLLGALPYSEFENAINLALLDTSPTLCTDVNRDRVNDDADIAKLIDYAFRGVEIPEGTNADLNEDGVVDILDVTVLTDYIIRNGPAPKCAIAEPSLVMNSCGDTNGDVTLDQADLDAITSYAFEGVEVPSNVNADLNNDGVIDIVDVVTMTNYVKRDGERPSCAEKPATEPESDKEEDIVEDNQVPSTSGSGGGGSGRSAAVAQNNEVVDNAEETAPESEDQTSDTSLEDIEQRLDDLEQKVDENNKILEKILSILGMFFKF